MVIIGCGLVGFCVIVVVVYFGFKCIFVIDSVDSCLELV